ncbi:ABC transporter substrate-binding protein [Variovorax ginsengisoli]|uniref:Peptide/nickel transport system substrate-binding protein n=1 Tax=Variovorax ginsengisoli TaxID=363844 RepID=A0ABT9S8M6_9BURK|nr:ABC transporter substrate-binding protein [Variovorax ginsengisoli]MDP9900704.1 peptide/nickel transport system substrate-binding protein [Variovorax ginsengisoli]
MNSSAFKRLFGMLLSSTFFVFAVMPSLAADVPKRGGTLVVAINADVRSLEPGINRDSNSDTVVHHIFEGLVGYRSDLSVGPALARSWSMSSDGRSYTFKLREGVTFHNGERLTAETVKWSWDRKMGQSGWLCARFFNGQAGLKVDAVEAPDPSTVVFRLASPSGLFLTQLANVQCGVLVAHPASVGTDGNWTPIGTGPFKLGTWKRGEALTLNRYEGYVASKEPASGYAGARLAHVDAVRFQVIPDADAAVAALKTGAIDIIPELDSIKMEELKAAVGVRVLSAPGLTWSTLLIQTEDPLLKNPDLRKAIAHGIDMEQLAAVRTNGLAKPNPSGVADSMRAFSPEFLMWPAYDPKLSAAAMKKAGYKGEPIKLQTNRRVIGMYDNAVMIQAMLSAVGLNVQLEVLDWSAQLDNYLNGRFQLSSFAFSPRFDPSLMYAAFVADKATAKWAQWGSPEARKMLEESSAAVDPAERATLFHRMHTLMREEVPIIGLYYSPTVEAVGRAVRGYQPWASGRPIAWGAWKE